VYEAVHTCARTRQESAASFRTVPVMTAPPSAPPPCVAAPFEITAARTAVLTASDDTVRAGAALVTPDLPWAGHARQAYDDATATCRSGLLRLGMLLDSCLLRLDALTVAAEAEVARVRAEAAAAVAS